MNSDKQKLEKPVSKSSDHNNIKYKIPILSIFKNPNQYLWGMDYLWTFQMNVDKQNLGNWSINDKWPYLNPNLDSISWSGEFSILQSPKQDLKDIDVICTYKSNLGKGYIKH